MTYRPTSQSAIMPLTGCNVKFINTASTCERLRSAETTDYVLPQLCTKFPFTRSSNHQANIEQTSSNYSTLRAHVF